MRKSITTQVLLGCVILLFSSCSLATADGVPTLKPSWKPTLDPTWEPTPRPTFEFAPTRYPTPAPTPRPSPLPTPFPTLKGGIHSSREPTPGPTLGMASYAMHYELFNQEVTLADMMAIAVTIWGAIFVFALRYHYRSSGTTDKLSEIRLDDFSAHSEMSDTSHTPALKDSHSSSAPFALKKNNVFNLRGSSSAGMSSAGQAVSNRDVVAAAVASALHMPLAPSFSNTPVVVMDMSSAPLPTPEQEEEEDLRL